MFDIWHCKLGNHSVNTIKKVLKDNKIEIKNIPSSYVCTYCQMKKSHKLDLS